MEEGKSVRKREKRNEEARLVRVDVQQQRSKQMSGEQACGCGRGREEEDGWMDGGEGWKSSGGEKVVVVEEMVVEEGSGRVEEKRKEKKS